MRASHQNGAYPEPTVDAGVVVDVNRRAVGHSESELGWLVPGVETHVHITQRDVPLCPEPLVVDDDAPTAQVLPFGVDRVAGGREIDAVVVAREHVEPGFVGTALVPFGLGVAGGFGDLDLTVRRDPVHAHLGLVERTIRRVVVGVDGHVPVDLGGSFDA